MIFKFWTIVLFAVINSTEASLVPNPSKVKRLDSVDLTLFELNYTWKINKISFNHLYSITEFPTYGSGDNDLIWQAMVRKFIPNYGSNYVGVMLKISEKSKQKSTWLTYSVRVKDLNGVIKYSNGRTTAEEFGTGASANLGHTVNLLTSIQNKEFINDTMIVEYELKIAKDQIKSSSLNVAFPDIPACDFTHEAANLILTDLRKSNILFKVPQSQNDSTQVLVPIPKVILTSKSSILDELITEAEGTVEKIEIPVPDLDKETLDFMLKFAYTDEQDIPEGMELRLIEIGSKYKMERIKLAAQRALGNKLTLDNALTMLENASRVNGTDLKNYVLDYVRMQSGLMTTENWTNLVSKMTTDQCEQITNTTCQCTSC